MGNAVANASAAETRVDFDEVTPVELPKLLDVVDRHLATSIHDENKREACMRELRHAGPHMAPTPSVNALMIIPLLREEDVMRVRSVIRKLTKAHGFADDRAAVVSAAVVELATDLLKRGRRGTLIFRKLGSPPGLEVTAFEGTKPADGDLQLDAVRVKADRFVSDSQAHMGTTIRATWFTNPNT
jgi:hypothetical protein